MHKLIPLLLLLSSSLEPQDAIDNTLKFMQDTVRLARSKSIEKYLKDHGITIETVPSETPQDDKARSHIIYRILSNTGEQKDLESRLDALESTNRTSIILQVPFDPGQTQASDQELVALIAIIKLSELQRNSKIEKIDIFGHTDIQRVRPGREEGFDFKSKHNCTDCTNTSNCCLGSVRAHNVYSYIKIFFGDILKQKIKWKYHDDPLLRCCNDRNKKSLHSAFEIDRAFELNVLSPLGISIKTESYLLREDQKIQMTIHNTPESTMFYQEKFKIFRSTIIDITYYPELK